MSSSVLPLPREHAHEHALALSPQAGLSMGALLVERGRLAAGDAERIHAHQQKTGQLFGEAGIELGLLGAPDVLAALSLQFGHVLPGRDCGLGAELVAVWQPASEAVEQLRTLRSQLMLRWFENDARHAALAVVSPGRAEGRSFLVANLGALFAQLGRRTLVIDADLRHPRQHRIFGVPGRTGLSGILAGRSGTEAVVDLPALPSLSLLPAGIAPPNPQELLARGVFTRLLSSLRPGFDVILVDTPAFATCADAGTVAARAGAALTVANRDSSTLPGLAALGRTLREFGVTQVGAVLNAAARH
jgi:chain length determinant protein tyrosine kinase EpsG